MMELDLVVTHVGETKRNVEFLSVSTMIHVRYLSYQNTCTTWNRKNLGASFIALKAPKLNNQVDSKKLTLFRHGVT